MWATAPIRLRAGPDRGINERFGGESNACNNPSGGDAGGEFLQGR